MQECLEGEMDRDLAFAISDEDLQKGYRLICIGSPLSDCVLDACPGGLRSTFRLLRVPASVGLRASPQRPSALVLR